MLVPCRVHHGIRDFCSIPPDRTGSSKAGSAANGVGGRDLEQTKGMEVRIPIPV